MKDICGFAWGDPEQDSKLNYNPGNSPLLFLLRLPSELEATTYPSNKIQGLYLKNAATFVT